MAAAQFRGEAAGRSGRFEPIQDATPDGLRLLEVEEMPGVREDLVGVAAGEQALLPVRHGWRDAAVVRAGEEQGRHRDRAGVAGKIAVADIRTGAGMETAKVRLTESMRPGGGAKPGDQRRHRASRWAKPFRPTSHSAKPGTWNRAM